MKRHLSLKKVTIRDLDETSLKTVAAGATNFTCDGCTMLMTNCQNTCELDTICYCGPTLDTCGDSCAFYPNICV